MAPNNKHLLKFSDKGEFCMS